MRATRFGCIELAYDDVPPSMNDRHSGWKSGHWGQGHRVKDRWQTIFAQLTLTHRTHAPRQVAHVYVEAHLYFPRANRRDQGNYRMLLEKSLGDALVTCGFLPDDTAEHFVFGAVHFHKGAKRTELRLRWTAGNQLELPADSPASTASPE